MRQYDVAELYNTALRDFGVAASSEAAYCETCFEVLREADNPFRRLSVGPNNHYGPTESGDFGVGCPRAESTTQSEAGD